MVKAILLFSVFVSLMMVASTGLVAQEQPAESQVLRDLTVFKSPT